MRISWNRMVYLLLAIYGSFFIIFGHEHSNDPEHHHDHDHDHHHKEENHGKSCSDNDATWQELFIPVSMREAVYNAIISTLFIGAVPVLCVNFVPNDPKILKVLLGFAAGGLMGDVFLHLLPHGLQIYSNIYDNNSDHNEHDHEHDQHDSHSHSHNIGHSILGMYIIIGFFIFFILEKLFHEFGHSHSHSHSNNDIHSQSHSHSDNNKNRNNRNNQNESKLRNRKQKQKPKHENNNENIQRESNLNDNDNDIDIDRDVEARKIAIQVLNILADFTHNFTDGLTIAASFLISTKMGLIQSGAILLHEVPHEIGDYAILIENGMSKTRAAFVQLLTAIGCLLGTFLGFIFEQTDLGTQWIIPFTCGGFLYIACVQALPSLVETKYGKCQSAMQAIGFAFGVMLMVLVGWVEENIDHFI